MAKDRTSKTRVERTSATPEVLEVIEEERTRLMQAESLLQCLLVALDANEGDMQGPYYPNVIELARDLLSQSIGQLDSLRLRPLMEQASGNKNYATAEEHTGTRGKDEVKESAQVVYLF